MLREELLRRFPRLTALPPHSWVVGGVLRDLLLGADPADVDVACNDPRACAEAISPRVIRLGTLDHLSAWRVVDGGRLYDFAEILDHDIHADLRRRDFTINAMALSLGSGELLDPYDGRGDLQKRLVRMVEPENFDDDPLRCLKAVRMAVRLRFEIDPATLEAIRARAGRIERVAAERVSFELSLILSAGQFTRAVGLLHSTRLDRFLFGRPLDASPFQADDLSLAAAYALLVEEPGPYARRWRWSTNLLREVVALQRLLAAEGDLRVPLFDAGQTVAAQLPALFRAVGRREAIVMPDFHIRALLSAQEIGLPEGPELGRRKRALLEAQIRGEVENRQQAVEFVRRPKE